MAGITSKSPVSIEKLKRSTLENDESMEITFQYISVQKMDCVLRVVKRKIQKEKELQMWLDYSSEKAIQETHHLETNSICNFVKNGNHQTNENFRDISVRKLETHSLKCQSNKYVKARNEPSHKPQQQSPWSDVKSRLALKTLSDLQRKLSKRSGACEKKLADSSLQTEYKNHDKHLHLMKNLPPAPTNRSSRIPMPAHFKSNITSKRPTPKSNVFTLLCAEMWQQLNQIEKIEERSLQHLKERCDESHFQSESPNSIKKSQRTSIYSSPLNVKTSKPKIIQPYSFNSTNADAMKLYDADTNCQLIKRLSNTITDEILSELMAELNDLPDLFMKELFENEFQLSSSSL